MLRRHWDLLVRGASLQPFLSFPVPAWALGVLKFADLESWTKPQRGVVRSKGGGADTAQVELSSNGQTGLSGRAVSSPP